MKKIIFAFALICFFPSCAIICKIVPWEGKTYNYTPWENFPFLTDIVDSYYVDNLTYPQSTDEILEYWNVYRKSSKNNLTNTTTRLLHNITFKRLKQEEDNFKIISRDSLQLVLYKQDTMCYILYDTSAGSSILRWNMQDFRRVSMQRDNTHGFSITTEKMERTFNNGLYTLVAKKMPEFRQNRIDQKKFNVEILEFYHGTLYPKCKSSQLDLKKHLLYNDILQYISEFAVKNNLSKIIFYYMYDCTSSS